MKTSLTLLFLPFIVSVVAWGEAPPDPAVDPLLLIDEAPIEATSDSRLADSLAALHEAIQIKEREYRRVQEAWREAETDLERSRALEQMEPVSEELNQLRKRFRETAAGIDLGIFEEIEKEPFSWEQKLGEILDPILRELESFTDQSRRIATLRDEVRRYSEQKEAAEKAAENIRRLMDLAEDEPLRESYRQMLDRWEERASFAASQLESSRLQLESLEHRDQGIIDGSAAFVRGFLQQRGRNLFLGIFAAAAVFFGMRLLIFLARRLRGDRNPRKLGGRIFVLTANLVAILGALFAMLVVFSVTGDLFLFAVVVLFLLGTSWAGIKVLPQFIESLKLILNIGMVREGERIVFAGIPWNVESLGFRSKLTNDLLDGGVQYLPVRELVGFHSRPWCKGEEIFPCRRGEWVQLSDESIGKVLVQNPGHVVLEEWGHSRKTFPTPDFLTLHPRNLSAGGFRVTIRFGIDYRHQREATEIIPSKMVASLREGLEKKVSSEWIRDIHVPLAEAGSSALEYEAQVYLTGEAAEEYENIRFELQRSLVDLCNQNGWIIPFKQITIHRSEGDPHASAG